MAHSRSRRPPPPLDERALRELALRYVGRFATTRAKLCAYLERKIRERGWKGSAGPDPAAIAERCSELGYVDDAAYALAKSRALTSRGYGKRRLGQALRGAGVGADDSQAAHAFADAAAIDAALRFAERRALGPFAASPPDAKDRQRALAAMVRAGHDFALARAVLALPAGEPVDRDEMRLALQ